MNSIEVRDVHKTYRRYGRRKQFATLKSALLSGSVLRDLRPDAMFEALKGVSFDVPAGKTFGLVGRNGSGKSTMLKLIAGIGKPTSGTVRVEGRVSALIELGAGFHPEISGRENVFINGMMLGLSRREITSRFDDIVRFAELEEFIDEPVKTYSSGMYMRLGFAVAINVDPDVLLVDEVLAVGDEAFTHKCLDKFADFRRRGRTVLLVTHSLDLVTRFCDEALWLDNGLAKAQGDPKRVVDAYLMAVADREDSQLAEDDVNSQRPTSNSQAAQLPTHKARVRTLRRPTCSRPRRGAGARARWRSRPSICSAPMGRRPTSFSRASRSRFVFACARIIRSATSRSALASSTRKASAATAPTRRSRAQQPASCWAKAKCGS